MLEHPRVIHGTVESLLTIEISSYTALHDGAFVFAVIHVYTVVQRQRESGT